MRLTSVLRRLLGDTQMHVQEAHLGNTGPLTVRVRPSWRRSRCGTCGARAPRYDRRPSRQWRHAPWGRTSVFLQYAPWRVSCRRCGVRVEAVSWASSLSVFTATVEELTAYLAQVTDRTTVSRVLGISWQAVGSILERVVAQRLDEPRFDGLRRIGIDEFSYRKRHHYLTIVVDHDRRTGTYGLAWVRSATDAGGVLRPVPSGQLRTAATGDGRLGGELAESAASARSPHARVVFDRFHMASLASDAVDVVRLTEQRGSDAKTAKALKGSRYRLLKHPKRLKPGENRRHGDGAPGESRARPRLRAEGLPGDDPGAGHFHRCRVLARRVASVGCAVTPGAVREAGADGPQARGGYPRLP